MSIPTLSASTSATPAPVIYQTPINVPLPTYDWNGANQMCEFRLFKCQLDSWIQLQKMKDEEHLDYLLCILGKEGYTAMDCWVPTDGVHKQDLKKFLDYLENTLDNVISPQVWVYELEDIKKRSGKSIDEIIDRIHQHAAVHKQVMVEMLLSSLRSNAGSFGPSQMLTLSCRRNSSRSVAIKRCHIYWRLVVHITPLSMEQLWCVLIKPSMPSAKAVSPIKTNHKSPLHRAQTAPIHTLLGVTTALHGVLSVMAVPKKVTGMQSATALVLLANNSLSLMEWRRPPVIDALVERGRKLIWYMLTLRKHPHAMSCLLMQLIEEL